jgi:hypothetical protein
MALVLPFFRFSRCYSSSPPYFCTLAHSSSFFFFLSFCFALARRTRINISKKINKKHKNLDRLAPFDHNIEKKRWRIGFETTLYLNNERRKKGKWYDDLFIVLPVCVYAFFAYESNWGARIAIVCVCFP